MENDGSELPREKKLKAKFIDLGSNIKCGLG